MMYWQAISQQDTTVGLQVLSGLGFGHDSAEQLLAFLLALMFTAGVVCAGIVWKRLFRRLHGGSGSKRTKASFDSVS